VTRQRVVVAGLGDSGLLTAIKLTRRMDVVGISAKPELVSGQELGMRLTRPDYWAKDYRVAFDRYRRLDRARIVHGTLTGLDLSGRAVVVQLDDGSTRQEPYDVLVISTGVTNGFWRQPTLQSTEEVSADLRSAHERLESARSVIVVGGGAAAVGSAANLASTWPDKQIDLYFPGERALPRHHGRVWGRVRHRLIDLGVGLHPGHRAELPDDFDEITSNPVRWSTGQEPVSADAVLWAVGKVRANTAWLPPELLDDDGFVRVTPELQVQGHPGVYAIGDVAATDPLRTSARNRADRLLARNVRAALAGRPLRRFDPPRRRWGSVLGVQHDGLEVFAPSGYAFRFPAWSVDGLLRGLIVRQGIYRGVRRAGPRPRRRD
jgi:apoptosis-inducing factor 2